MLLLRVLAAILAFAASAWALAADVEPASLDEAKFTQLMNEGAQLVAAKRPLEAMANFDQVIAGYEAAFPAGEARFYCARGTTESLMYLLEAAAAKKSAKVVSANWAFAHYLKAYSLVELGRAAEAKAELGRAIALSPRNALFLAELGHIHQSGRNWPLAMETYRAAEAAAREFSPPAQKNAELSRAWRGIGFVYIEERKFDEAEKMYRQCLELDAADQRALSELRYIEGLRARKGGR